MLPLISFINLTGHHCCLRLSLALLTHPSTLGFQHFRGLLTLLWGLMALSLHIGKPHFQYSASFYFRSVSWINFVYNYGITEITNEKMYVLIKVLSAWTHPTQENYQYYLILLCHTKWFTCQLLKSIWILGRIMIGRCVSTYSNRNVWGCCLFVPLLAKNKYISFHIWNF